MSEQETREALFELWMRFGTTIESDSSEGWEMVDAILSRFAVTPKDETEWEYGRSEILNDGTTAFGSAVPTIEEAIRRRDALRASYPWPEEIGLGRRRKAGPWEPVTEGGDAP